MVIIAIAAACCVGTKNRIVDIVCTSPTRAVLPLPRRTYVRFSPNPRPRLLCFAEGGSGSDCPMRASAGPPTASTRGHLVLLLLLLLLLFTQRSHLYRVPCHPVMYNMGSIVGWVDWRGSRSKNLSFGLMVDRLVVG